MLFDIVENIWFLIGFETYWKSPQYPSNLKGDVSLSAYGQLYMSFEGIRYAEPAVDIFRFRDPVPIEKIVYLKKKVDCLEWDPVYDKIIGEEDCLFLNIYTPVPFIGKTFPVLIWIHGTQFRLGTSQESIYGPERLIDHNLIVVTMNYRVGPLGFATLGHKDFSGNYGLKDQREAIRWVLKNIEKFGGDLNMVTLGGEGFGAACVEYHLSGELSNNISRAIVIGGTWLSPWALSTVERVKNETERLAHLVGCNTCNGSVTLTEPVKMLYNTVSKKGTNQGIVEQSSSKIMRISCEYATANCLRYTDPQKIVKEAFNMPQVLPWEKVILPFQPIVDGDVITNDPWKTRDSKKEYSLLLGVTRNEGSFITTIGINNGWEEIDYAAAFHVFFDTGIARGRSFLNNDAAIQTKVAGLYQDGRKIENQLADLITDGWFMLPALADAKYHRGSFDAFMFNYKSDYQHMGCTVLRSSENPSHGDQMPFMFLVYKCGTEDTLNELFANKFTAMIANFVYKRDLDLKSYMVDNQLFTIKKELFIPILFETLDENFAGRLEHWRSFDLF